MVNSVSKVVEAYGILVAKHERIRPLGRAMTIGADNIKMDPKKYIGWMWSGFVWVKIGSFYGDGYELSNTLKCLNWAEEIRAS